MYRQSIGEFPTRLQQLFIANQAYHSYNTGIKNEPRMGQFLGQLSENSLIVKGSRLWSNLPYELNECTSINSFSNNLWKWATTHNVAGHVVQEHKQNIAQLGLCGCKHLYAEIQVVNSSYFCFGMYRFCSMQTNMYGHTIYATLRKPMQCWSKL